MPDDSVRDRGTEFLDKRNTVTAYGVEFFGSQTASASWDVFCSILGTTRNVLLRDLEKYMPITAIAALALGFTGPMPPLYCPATLEKITGEPALTVEYGGIVFGTCCAGCGNPILKNTQNLLDGAIKSKRTVGTFEYDPISGLKITVEKANAFSDYRSIRYLFSSKEEKKTFDASPSKYVSDVKSEAYFDPVMNQGDDSASASTFSDYNGVRYFLCSTDSLKQFRANPAKFVPNAASSVKPLKAVKMAKR